MKKHKDYLCWCGRDSHRKSQLNLTHDGGRTWSKATIAHALVRLTDQTSTCTCRGWDMAQVIPDLARIKEEWKRHVDWAKTIKEAHA
jgi:hypothetical protein